MSEKTNKEPKPTPLLDALAKDMATQDSQDIYEANKESALQFYGMTPLEYAMSVKTKMTAAADAGVLKDFDGGRKGLLSRFREVFRRETEGSGQ